MRNNFNITTKSRLNRYNSIKCLISAGFLNKYVKECSQECKSVQGCAFFMIRRNDL